MHVILGLSYVDSESVNCTTRRGVNDGKEYSLMLTNLHYLITDILKCTDTPKLRKIDISHRRSNETGYAVQSFIMTNH